MCLVVVSYIGVKESGKREPRDGERDKQEIPIKRDTLCMDLIG